MAGTFRRMGAAGMLLLAWPLPCADASTPGRAETIVLLRHGEKPPGGLGQLDCQGLNRALKLPGVLAQFGAPSAIFAPNPSMRKTDSGKPYDYIRPLATIEPTAIALGMPVDVSLGVDDWQTLGRRLEAPAFDGRVVFVAWEHSDIVKLARMLVGDAGGDAAAVPEWDHRDFDGMFVLRIAQGQPGRVTFLRQREGLDGQPMECAGAAAKSHG